MSPSNYSSKDLFAFLEWAASRHVVKKNTADSWKTASQKVLETLDASEQEDLRSLDIDDALQRFENRAGRNYKPESLRIYRSRFSTAVEQFLKWKSNPSTYKLEGRAKTSSAKSANRTTVDRKRVVPSDKSGTILERSDSPTEAWMLPIPLRPGVLVKIFGLPLDLTPSEARKIGAVIAALAGEGEQ